MHTDGTKEDPKLQKDTSVLSSRTLFMLFSRRSSGKLTASAALFHRCVNLSEVYFCGVFGDKWLGTIAKHSHLKLCSWTKRSKFLHIRFCCVIIKMNNNFMGCRYAGAFTLKRRAFRRFFRITSLNILEVHTVCLRILRFEKHNAYISVM